MVRAWASFLAWAGLIADCFSALQCRFHEKGPKGQVVTFFSPEDTTGRVGILGSRWLSRGSLGLVGSGWIWLDLVEPAVAPNLES